MGFTKKLEVEKEDIFPKSGEKVSSDAKKFIERLKKVRATLDALADEASVECAKFSEDVKFWAEFQTGVKVFEPWLKNAEARKQEGLKKPVFGRGLRDPGRQQEPAGQRRGQAEGARGRRRLLAEDDQPQRGRPEGVRLQREVDRRP